MLFELKNRITTINAVSLILNIERKSTFPYIFIDEEE